MEALAADRTAHDVARAMVLARCALDDVQRARERERERKSITVIGITDLSTPSEDSLRMRFILVARWETLDNGTPPAPQLDHALLTGAACMTTTDPRYAPIWLVDSAQLRDNATSDNSGYDHDLLAAASVDRQRNRSHYQRADHD